MVMFWVSLSKYVFQALKPFIAAAGSSKIMFFWTVMVYSLIPRPSPSFLLLAVRTASDGKLGEGLGTRLDGICCEQEPLKESASLT